MCVSPNSYFSTSSLNFFSSFLVIRQIHQGVERSRRLSTMWQGMRRRESTVMWTPIHRMCALLGNSTAPWRPWKSSPSTRRDPVAAAHSTRRDGKEITVLSSASRPTPLGRPRRPASSASCLRVSFFFFNLTFQQG